jgi:hypothetical protein
MGKISKQTTSEHLDYGGIEDDGGTLDGYTVCDKSTRRPRDLEAGRVTQRISIMSRLMQK